MEENIMKTNQLLLHEDPQTMEVPVPIPRVARPGGAQPTTSRFQRWALLTRVALARAI